MDEIEDLEQDEDYHQEQLEQNESAYDVQYSSEYTEFNGEYGTIRIYHEMTLGDMANFTLLAVLILIVVLKTLFNLIWRD